jgi:CubicO group peptidase (beta-lactamase class C family)
MSGRGTNVAKVATIHALPPWWIDCQSFNTRKRGFFSTPRRPEHAASAEDGLSNFWLVAWPPGQFNDPRVPRAGGPPQPDGWFVGGLGDVTRRATRHLSRGVRHAIFLTRSDRTRLLSLTGQLNCRAILAERWPHPSRFPASAEPVPEAATGRGDAVAILYTSGTTGGAKGLPHLREPP